MKALLGSCTKLDVAGFEQTPTYTSMLKGLKRGNNNNYQFYEGEYTDAVIKTNNTENIGKHYNEVLEMGIDEGYECVILMHDDVHIDDYFWPTKIAEAFEEYDIVGLAGGKQIEIKSPALWHLMAKQEDWSGAVAHPANEKQIFMTNFGPMPQRCLVLDGLFLAIKVSSLTPEIRFDENIPGIAHHYDIDFCLNANKHKLKLTTWPIWAIHKSPGLEEPGQHFIDSEKYFLDKWATK